MVQSDTDEMKDILMLGKQAVNFTRFACRLSCGGHMIIQKC